MTSRDGSERVVVRFMDGRIVKGALLEFSETSDRLTVCEAESWEHKTVDCSELKAVFFVRTFEGNAEYRESKSYASTRKKGQKIFIKFKDGENIVGFLDSGVPWDKGFFLHKRDEGVRGFFILPVDEHSNNARIFVFSSAVQAVTVVP